MDEIPPEPKPQLPAKPEETPDLFPPGEIERPDLVQMVRRGGHKFTGERLSRDEELCRSVCADILLGISGRAIARKYHISRSSVVAIEHLLRANGEMENVKVRVLDLLSKVATVGLEEWLHALETGKIAPGQIPIPVLAALDKKAQLEAGVVLGTGRTEKELSVDDLEAAWSKVVSAGPVIDVPAQPIDSPSAVPSQNPQQIPQNAQSAVSLAGELSVRGWSIEPNADPQPAPVPASASTDPASAVQMGGGGVPPRDAGGGENETGSVSRD
mgnify:FL=1